MKLNYLKSKRNKIIASVLTSAMVLNLFPKGLFSVLSGLFETKVGAEGVDMTESVHGTAPDYSGESDLYKGENAISPLPKSVNCKSDYSHPEYLTVSELRRIAGTGNAFDSSDIDMTDKKIMIGTPTDLYYFSLGANSDYASEKQFYLSGDYVLGANIEWSTMSSDMLLQPIGTIGNSANDPFTGTFDGQGFEIRDMVLNTEGSYTGAYCALFGYVGSGAEIKNFGVYHPSIKCNSSGIYAAVIAGRNEGTIKNVYAVVDEFNTYVNSETGGAPNSLTVTNIGGGAAGLVYRNESGAYVGYSYFAGTFNNNGRPVAPVCMVGSGTITKCYYDAQIYSKPVMQAVPEGKKSIVNESPNYYVYMFGISYNMNCNTYNKGDLLSVYLHRVIACGIGQHPSLYKNMQQNHYLIINNCNEGNISFFNGVSGGYGISAGYSYCSKNKGNITLYEGDVYTPASTVSKNIGIGSFIGCSEYTFGCYNEGDVTLRPSGIRYTEPIGSSILSNLRNYGPALCAAGTASVESKADIFDTGSGEKLYLSVNKGTITIDGNTNSFDPVYYGFSGGKDYVTLQISGTGLGDGNRNYGRLYYDANDEDDLHKLNVYICGCGSATDSYNHDGSNSVNYTDIKVDLKNTAGDCRIYGGIRTKVAVPEDGGYNAENIVNYGDIYVTGNLSGSLGVFVALYANGGLNAKRIANFGTITVDKECTAGDFLYAVSTYNKTDSERSNAMECCVNGHSGKSLLPEGFYVQEADIPEDQFNVCDKSVSIGGVSNRAGGNYLENRGNITVEDLTAANVNGRMYYSATYGKSDLEDQNANSVYMDMDNIRIGGVQAMPFGYSAGFLWNGITLGNSVNYGNISIRNMPQKVTVGGIVPSNQTSLAPNGLGTTIRDCLNYGDINIYNASNFKCYVGGIVGVLHASTNQEFSNCLNFGNMSIENPNSYLWLNTMQGGTQEQRKG